ncbi:MAG: COX15/CtaA family protein [Chitinophagaceae bacterium]|nr:COX15/CtaA family protein [Chitinophagaceae bacterium]
MENTITQRNNRWVATWLLVGVAMIIVQVLLGGITRLTESGLSITEWKPITGTLPTLSDAAWQAEFDKYKFTDQFKYVHQNFTLSNFKFIFFWEWFHRLWARLIGVVFLVGFVYFLVTKKFNKQMVMPMIVLFVLGGLQGLIGWVMVKSGLVPEKFYVGHIELTTHFTAAMGVLCYTIWFALSLLKTPQQKIAHAGLQKLMLAITILLAIQLIYGGFMAGLKAAITAPTWPYINGYLVPPGMTELTPFTKNLVSNPITVHFIHRGIAYLLVILIGIWFVKAKKLVGNLFFNRLRMAVLLLISTQLILGILTVLNATYPNRLLILGVVHQFTGMLLLINVITILFVLKKKRLYS